MSHSIECDGVTFVYNSDLSGNVHIRNAAGQTIEVPGEAILKFVAWHVSLMRVSALEQADYRTILGLPEE